MYINYVLLDFMNVNGLECEMDWILGEILGALQDAGVADDH